MDGSDGGLIGFERSALTGDGRLSIPVPFQAALGRDIIALRGPGNVLCLYPLAAFAARLEEIGSRPELDFWNREDCVYPGRITSAAFPARVTRGAVTLPRPLQLNFSCGPFLLLGHGSYLTAYSLSSFLRRSYRTPRIPGLLARRARDT